MEQTVSYCGLLCIGCPIYIATGEPNAVLKEKMKIKIAKTCNNMYHTEFTSKDITDCDGCLNENGRHFPSCNECRIRGCARIHQAANCAFCDEYPCETLNEFFLTNKESKDRLDFIKSVL